MDWRSHNHSPLGRRVAWITTFRWAIWWYYLAHRASNMPDHMLGWILPCNVRQLDECHSTQKNVDFDPLPTVHSLYHDSLKQLQIRRPTSQLIQRRAKLLFEFGLPFPP
jgi:hypothetical protein